MAVEATEGKKPGLPQFDLTFFPGQIFWLAISFVLLYVLMAFVALPRVRHTQTNRHQILSDDLNAAEAANEAAKATITQYEKALAQARQSAQATVAEIMVANSKEATQRQAEQHQTIVKVIAEAETKITSARDQAIADAHSSAGDLAAVIIEKVAGLKLNLRG